MTIKRRNQPHLSTKQALSLTSRQRAYRLHQQEEKADEGKTIQQAKDTRGK